MTQLATREDKINAIKTRLADPGILAQFQRAIRTGEDAKTIARIALTTLCNEKNKQLLECSHQSILASIVTACALGLEPDNVRGLAYLVPYGKTCTLIPGYLGFIQLMWRSGQVANVSAHNVYDQETFTYNCGAVREIEHIPKPPDKQGKYIGSYTRVDIKGSSVPHFEFMWDEEIEAIRARSPAKDKGPWVTDTDAMRKKTTVRRAAKWVPSSPQLQQAVALDEQAERGAPQSLDMIDVQVIESADAETPAADQTLREIAAAEAAKQSKGPAAVSA